MNRRDQIAEAAFSIIPSLRNMDRVSLPELIKYAAVHSFTYKLEGESVEIIRQALIELDNTGVIQ